MDAGLIFAHSGDVERRAACIYARISDKKVIVVPLVYVLQGTRGARVEWERFVGSREDSCFVLVCLGKLSR